MRTEPVNNTNFGILKKVYKTPYGERLVGKYKGYNIEVYNAKKYNQFLIYVSNIEGFVKSKLTYFQDGIKKITKAEGQKYDTLV